MTRQTTDPILELQDVSFRYPDGSVGLDRCSLLVQRGSRATLVGANGAGKTTLFLHLNGILRPQTGTAIYGGKPLDYGRQGLHGLRSRVGLVFQNPDSQLFSASVREDVSFGPLNLGLDNETVRRRVEEALLSVGMADCADKLVHNLSYGQKKRVCIAGVLAMRPEILILDEPMAGLDVAMQANLTHILDRLHAAGMTIIIATHDMDFAYQWADSITVMVQGRCAATWDVNSIPGVLEQLAAYGLGVPKVAEIHQGLVSIGFLDHEEPALRSHQELLRILADRIRCPKIRIHPAATGISGEWKSSA
jgi:cobalt/nickel transport system ATP-binding protein